MSLQRIFKEHFEEIMILLATVGLACMIYYVYITPCVGCTYTNKQGVAISGDCEQLRRISDMENQKEVVDGAQMLYVVDWDNLNVSVQ